MSNNRQGKSISESRRIAIMANENNLEARYPLETVDGVYSILKNLHYLNSLKYKGDYDACNLLIDFQDALDRVKFTPKQAQALHYVFVKDMNQGEAAKIIGGSQQSVGLHIKGAVKKIVQAYREAQSERLREIEEKRLEESVQQYIKQYELKHGRKPPQEPPGQTSEIEELRNILKNKDLSENQKQEIRKEIRRIYNQEYYNKYTKQKQKKTN